MVTISNELADRLLPLLNDYQTCVNEAYTRIKIKSKMFFDFFHAADETTKIEMAQDPDTKELLDMIQDADKRFKSDLKTLELSIDALNRRS